MHVTHKINVKHSVFFSWLVSYIAILLVPVLISGVVYYESSKIVHNEINRANTAILKQVRQVVDSRMSDLERFSMDVALNDRIRAIMYAKDKVDSSYRYQLVEIIRKELKTYGVVNQFVDAFYIYLKNSDFVLCPGFYYPVDVAYEDFHHNSGLDYQEWYALLQEKYYKTCLAIPIGNVPEQNRTIVYFHSLPPEGNKSAATLVVLLNKNHIKDIVSSFEWIEKGSFFVVDRDNRIIISNADNDFSGLVDYKELEKDNGIFYKNVNGQENVISYMKSTVIDWKYVSVIPTSVFLEKAVYIKRLTTYSLLLCILAGGIIAFLFTKRNYNPLGELVSAIENRIRLGDKQERNEYQFIRQALHSVLTEKEEIYRRLESQSNEMRHNFLRRLMQGRVIDNNSVFDILTSYNIQFNSDRFAVLLFKIEDYDKLFNGEDKDNAGDKLRLVQFVVSNVVEEIAGQNHVGYMTEMGEIMACLVNLNGQDNYDGKEELMKIAKEAKSFIEKHLFILLTISISNIHNTLPGIPQAYQEAVEAIEYRMVVGTGEIISYEDIKNPCRSYKYSLELEHQLINNIKAGDFEKAKSILEGVFSDNLVHGVLSVDMAKCLMFDLVSTMIKTMDEFNGVFDEDTWENINPVESLLRCNSVLEMKECMEHILYCVCSYIEDKKQSHNIVLKNGIIDFVKRNFHDANISNTMIAEHFGVNPAYLSRFFKEQTGEGLSEFINKVRLEEAKRLLREQNLNIAEVADKTGYSNSVALIRAFKRYEGITPGKYKAMKTIK